MPNLAASISEIKFNSTVSAAQQFRKLASSQSQIGPAVEEALKLSPTKGLMLAKGFWLFMGQ